MQQKFYDTNKITLSDTEPFAQGGNRFCYVHPDNQELCIKVVKQGSAKRLKAKRSFIKKLRPESSFDDNINEYKAYQQSAILNNEPRIYDHIPRCYGWQQTDMGMGLLSDYYAQDDGTPCKTLEHYLRSEGLTDEINHKISALENYLYDTLLMTKNILPHNVVIAKDEKLKIIDGLGASSAFNILTLSNATKKSYIKRRIDNMHFRLQWEIGDRAISWVETNKLRKK